MKVYEMVSNRVATRRGASQWTAQQLGQTPVFPGPSQWQPAHRPSHYDAPQNIEATQMAGVVTDHRGM